MGHALRTNTIPSPRSTGTSRRTLQLVGWFAVLTTLFALAYNQSPLYTSNQNQYFLHGYAQAGYGTLSEDWLANTADPTPVFSFLVAETISLFRCEKLFFVYYAFLMGIYIFSLFGIVDQVFKLRHSKLTPHIFIAAIILLHSTVLRAMLQRLFGGDWPYLFEGGVAGQRLLGPVFQPSTFGVFLLLSIYLYMAGKKIPAILSAALAATFHPTYLLSAGALTLAYMIDTYFVQKKIWPAFRLGSLALITVLPILIYTAVYFGVNNSPVEKAARDILVNTRIPAHTIVADWFNATVVVKLAFMGIGVFLARRNRLMGVLLIPLILAIGLTILQIVTKNTTLALIFPWRLSTWLLPISVGLIVAKLVQVTVPKVPVSWFFILRITSLVFIGLAVMAGVTRIFLDKAKSDSLSSRPIEAYVAAHRQPGQVTLTPSNLYDFRLETGTPIYVDFLSIPYKGADVVEWYQRFLLASRFYLRKNCDMLSDFYDEGVTQVILPASFPQECPQLVETYSDNAFKLFNLTP